MELSLTGNTATPAHPLPDHASMARIDLISSKEQLPEDRQEDWAEIHDILGRVGGPFQVLLHSPGLAPKVCRAGAHVRLNSELSLAERELALLATAREKDGSYEWAHHTPIAREAGVTDGAIAAIRDRAATSELAPAEAEIIDYTRELLRTNRVTRPLFDSLRDRHGVRWLVELTATIGQYQYIAAINNAFGIEPKPGGEALPI
jgi:4-carboxymuconolactone decarboxylase